MNWHLRPGGYKPRGQLVFNTPKPASRKYRTHQSGDGGPNQVMDRIRCSVCGFPGVSIETVPGENFPTVMQTTGTTYVWASPDQPVTILDKQVLPVPQSKVSCPFCGATRFLDGQKGKGQ